MTDAEFEAAFDQHKDAVYRFAWRMLPSAAAAEDVVQDTVHRVMIDRAKKLYFGYDAYVTVAHRTSECSSSRCSPATGAGSRWSSA